ncbi:MAG: hypothetical protein AAFP69_24345, partial [Planctomycetota bacterium]
LAGAGRYLSNILIDHPGMIDDLIDSLLRHELPNAEQVDQLSIELCRGASELSSILHSFKASMHLMIGVHDLLGSADLSQTHSALASVADACIRRVVAYHHEQLASQYGDPVDAAGNPTQLVVLGLGRLGGREPNYHSDLDVMFLYSDDGNTQRRVGGPRQTTTNQHFFAELKQHVLQQFAAVRHAGGRHLSVGNPAGGLSGSHAGNALYDMDASIRPRNAVGVEAISIAEFARYFSSGLVPLWQRFALCKARVVCGDRRIACREQCVAAPVRPAMRVRH